MEVYIARDKDDALWCYTMEKPVRCMNQFVVSGGERFSYYQLDGMMFKEITWKNSPVLVELNFNIISFEGEDKTHD